MGSTGHSLFGSKGTGALDNDTFGIKGAVVFIFNYNLKLIE